LLQIAGLPRSTFYDHRRRLSRRDTQTDIKEAIRGAFEAANSAYGHRRILSVLLRQGWTVSQKTVLKLMRELGLQCPVRRRKRYNSFRGEVGEAADNVLNRQFETGFRHTKWATDVTEFNIGSSKVYVSPILDLYDNRIISATAGPSPSVKVVTDGLRIAIEALNAGEKPLVHSDSETVRTGIPGVLDSHSDGRNRMLVPGAPGVLDSHSDRQPLSFPGSVSPREYPVRRYASPPE
jgi:putative transposase